MRQFGKVDIPQNTFLNALKMNDNQYFFLSIIRIFSTGGQESYRSKYQNIFFVFSNRKNSRLKTKINLQNFFKYSKLMSKIIFQKGSNNKINKVRL